MANGNGNGNGRTAEDLCIIKRKTPPFWLPDTQSIMQVFLSISAVALVWYVVRQLLSDGGLKIDQTVRDLVVFILGIIFGCFKDVYGFTFGSSAGQRRQGEMLSQSMQDKDKIIADNVVSTAAASSEALRAAVGNSSSDALKAAIAVAPIAAAAAAPPAADIAAPPAAREAVAEAMAQHESETKPKE